MNTQRYLLTPAVAAVIALWSTTSLKAGDTPSPAPATMPAPGPLTYNTQSGAGGCPTCAAGQVGSTGCKSCGSSWFQKHDHKGPYAVNLCPGACFGYFQTQWRKWDDVCPYPYQGMNVSDSPRPVAPVLPAPTNKPTGTLPTPQPPEPKPGVPKPMSPN